VQRSSGSSEQCQYSTNKPIACFYAYPLAFAHAYPHSSNCYCNINCHSNSHTFTYAHAFAYPLAFAHATPYRYPLANACGLVAVTLYVAYP